MKTITTEEALRQIYAKIEGINYAMITSTGQDGLLRSRPMPTTKAEHNGELWFFIYDESDKAKEVARNAQVNLSYSDNSNATHVSISGIARVVQDRQRMERLWNPLFRSWFPKALDEPGIALLCVTIEEVEFWDTTSSKVGQLFQMAKSILTGSQANPGEHKEIKLGTATGGNV
jgi:general stress protein 26